MFYRFIDSIPYMLNNIGCYNRKFSARVQYHSWNFKTLNLAFYSCNACRRLLLLNEIYFHRIIQNILLIRILSLDRLTFFSLLNYVWEIILKFDLNGFMNSFF